MIQFGLNLRLNLSLDVKGICIYFHNESAPLNQDQDDAGFRHNAFSIWFKSTLLVFKTPQSLRVEQTGGDNNTIGYVSTRIVLKEA